MTLHTDSRPGSKPDFQSFPTYKSWKKIGTHPRFGTLIPLSQLRSVRNHGVGDFADLEAFGEFCKSIGCTIIQLLPINDMGKGETPYSSLSAFALDPVYIAVDHLTELVGDSGELIKFFEENKERVLGIKVKKRIEFDNIRTFKLEALKIAFSQFLKIKDEEGKDTLTDFENFKKEQEYWLPDYSLFRALKEANSWDSWEKWSEGAKTRKKASITKLKKSHADEIEFYNFVQWIAFKQLTDARKKLAESGILIKGDLPLLVDYESSDVWSHNDFFNLGVCAGAPPDQYSELGQNWGMPTYDWGNIQKDDFTWWRKRLKYAENFYDIFRIDHVVGLFRIWTIPITEEFPRGKKAGPNGYFDPQDRGQGHHKMTWLAHGRTLLDMMVESTDMLPIGEDLGTIPYVCRMTLKEMGIPGYKVVIWEREWKDTENNAPYTPVNEYPYVSMSSTTTHDFWTLPGWWETVSKDKETAAEEELAKKMLWNFVGLNNKRDERYTDKLHKALMKKMFHSGSVFLIMPFHDLWGVTFGLFNQDPVNDRINDPDQPTKPQNWTGKMPIEIEDLVKHPVMEERIRFIGKMAKESGRINFTNE